MQDEGVGEDVAEQASQGRLAAGRCPADAHDDGFSIRHVWFWVEPAECIETPNIETMEYVVYCCSVR